MNQRLHKHECNIRLTLYSSLVFWSQWVLIILLPSELTLFLKMRKYMYKHANHYKGMCREILFQYLTCILRYTQWYDTINVNR